MFNFLSRLFNINEEFNKIERNKFSDVLPYYAYDEQSGFYYLKDNSAGWIYECTPLIFAGKSMQSLSNIFKQPYPEKTVIQTFLYADPYLEDILDSYKELRNSNSNLNEIYKAQIERFCDFFRQGAGNGMWQLSGTPIRNFKLYISIKVPIKHQYSFDYEKFIKEANKIYKDQVNDTMSLLRSASLEPRPVCPADFLFLLKRIFNPDILPKKYKWDKSKPLNKQIINGETLITRDNGALQIGSIYARCITPKQFPSEIDSFVINDMLGYFGRGAESSNDDLNQIKCPFIFSSTFIFENLSNYLDMRANQVNIQRAGGNLAAGIAARREETSWCTAQREQKGEVFGRVITAMWLFDKNEDELYDKVNRVVSMWTNLNIEPQKELSFILPKLFVSSLPLGMYGNDYKDLERDHIMPSSTMAHVMTIQAGCLGIGKPYMLFMDRRAQLMSVDILYTGANKNFLLTGGSGGGKSFFLNYLTNSYMSIGAKIRIIDVGKSYEKLADMFGGQFIHFAESNIVLNFFDGIGNIKETDADSQADFADKISMLTGIIGTMCSRNNSQITPIQVTLIENALRVVYRNKKENTTIDDLIDYFNQLSINDIRDTHHASEGKHLALALEKYGSNGEYGYLFRGKSNVTFNNMLSIIELDGVPEDLRRVVVLAFASMIEDEVYNGDRKTVTLVILDEAWQTLSENPVAAKFAEGLYRKIRKYNGAVGIATQSIMDTSPTGKLGQLGVTIRGQSNMHFMLPDNGFITAKDQSILKFSDFEWEMLVNKLPSKSLPKYSEMIIQSDKVIASARLTTDEFTYFVCSSDATDNIFLSYWRDKFMSKDNTLNKMQAGVLAIEKAVAVCKELGGIGEFKHYINTKFLPEIKNEETQS